MRRSSRGHGRTHTNLSPSQQSQVRTYLEAQYEEQGSEFPEDQDTSTQDLLQGLGGMVQRVSRPAILLSDEVPKAQADKLLHLIDTNRVKATEILSQEFESGGVFGGQFSDSTDNAIRELFAVLALNYVAILMLQGRNIARKLPDDHRPKTVGDWLSGHLSKSPLAQHLPDDTDTQQESEAA